MTALLLSRRAVVSGGSLLVGFTLFGGRARAKDTAEIGDLSAAPMLDSWIRLNPDGTATVFTGKAELGQGITTALTQIAAEELDLELEQVKLVTADTALTPNEGYTAGSHSMQNSGTAIRDAASEVRAILTAAAAAVWGIPGDQLTTQAGRVMAPDGRSLGYGELARHVDLHRPAEGPFPLTPPDQFRIVGNPVPRLDIPAKLTGASSFVQDIRLPGMVHGRIVRPLAYQGRLARVDTHAAQSMPGVLSVVRAGGFLGVIAEREFQAIQAMQALAASAKWEGGHRLPAPDQLTAFLQSAPVQDIVVLDRTDLGGPPQGRSLRARYTRPFLAHGSIGPSCAVALFGQDGGLTIWTATQGVFPLRKAIAELLHMPEQKVRCIHVEGAGCYGQNGADDVAADAAMLARAMPGRPVRVQWMRDQEQEWEPYGPAMAVEAAATLSQSGLVSDWRFEIWSNTHARRPGPAGVLLAGREVEPPFPSPPPKAIPMPEGGGDRNSIPLYMFPSARVVYHLVEPMPLRVSALRSLGAHANIFAIESFMDELAQAAGSDPVAFRLAHLDDPRARAVIEEAAVRFGWSTTPARSGRGFAFARYKNLGAYCAVAVQVAIGDGGQIRLRRAVAAVDSGQAVNPDGIANQVEGAILQSASWTLYEQVGFTPERITSRDWASYPIMRFNAVPEQVEVHVIDRPGAPYLGTGECGQGPTAAALGNAIADATGVRLRDMPLKLPTKLPT